MSDLSTSNKRPVLTRSNYFSWQPNFTAYASAKGLGLILSGKITEPVADDPAKPTREERKDLAEFLKSEDMLSGELWMALDPSVQEEVKKLLGKPREMWVALEKKYNVRVPGARFTAYNNFLNIRLRTDLEKPDEILPTLISDIKAAVSRIRDLRPEDTPLKKFSIEDLDDELSAMVAVRAISTSTDPRHLHLHASLTTRDDISFAWLDDMVHRDFASKDDKQGDNDPIAVAMAAGKVICFACGGEHFLKDCDEYKKFQQSRGGQRGGRGRGRGRGGADSSSSSQTTAAASVETAGMATQFAGKGLLHT